MKIKRWSTSGGVMERLSYSSTVPPPTLTSSVPLTVSTMERMTQRVRVMSRFRTTVESVSQIRIVWSLVEWRLPLHTRSPATQTVNAMLLHMEVTVVWDNSSDLVSQFVCYRRDPDWRILKKASEHHDSRTREFCSKFKESPSKMDKNRHVHIHVGTRVVSGIRQTKNHVLKSIIDYW